MLNAETADVSHEHARYAHLEWGKSAEIAVAVTFGAAMKRDDTVGADTFDCGDNEQVHLQKPQ